MTTIRDLIAKAESADQWGAICLLEDEAIALKGSHGFSFENIRDVDVDKLRALITQTATSQFGVGA